MQAWRLEHSRRCLRRRRRAAARGARRSATRSPRCSCGAATTSPSDAREFLRARRSPSTASTSPAIDAAAELVERHVAAGERITVHGDYDADGICATAVMVRSLAAARRRRRQLHPRPQPRATACRARPSRSSPPRGTALIVTVDCAITAVEEVELAHELGVEVLVTDHHRPRADGVLPDAPIVHPAVCGYPFAGLCGAAVAHKFAQALETRAGIEPRRGATATSTWSRSRRSPTSCR